VPLLAFDTNLQRLGMGKGFYDNTIDDLKRKNPDLKSFGIAFNFQHWQQALPLIKTDLSLDYVATDINIFVAK
jgi:5-formyltetrahydrofolate cyclo-ligase